MFGFRGVAISLSLSLSLALSVCYSLFPTENLNTLYWYLLSAVDYVGAVVERSARNVVKKDANT